ncbi:hypothetical protein J2S58_002079 [Nakamurella flavida]|uniref:hypothetical protein n=1 Tax=Nakamurella flavida TaxID=363630 RepID=UPI002783EE4D|nr:hypothetical protein [Nakamurella flavida]MDP9778456.1 hypothetical protein [Nakamurella flavida]
MDRRLSGAILLVAALVTLAVSAGARSTVSGEAFAVPVPPPPAVGACFPTAFPPELATDPAASGGRPGVRLRTGPGACTGSWYGEVVEVYDETAAGAEDAYVDCFGAALRYVGLPEATGGVAWQPFFRPTIELVLPTRRQAAAGQDWTACAIGTDPYGAGAPWTTTVAGGWPRNPVFSAAARCTDDYAPASYTGVDCSRPHRTEVLAETWTQVESPDELDASCRDFATAAALLSDPTAGGRLTVSAVRDEAPAAGRVGPPTRAACLATPTDPAAVLTASLLGLGDADLPLR